MSQHKDQSDASLVEALKQHRLPHDTPSQLADAFRNGYRAALARTHQPEAAQPDDALIRTIGEALLSAHDHLEMYSLERSHCNSAAIIREGLAAFSAFKQRPDFAPPPQQPAQVVPEADALQGAANWIVRALISSKADHVAEIQQRLLIGYNRAARLYDAAASQHGERDK